MAERNEDVLKMIAQLRARLADLEADVRAFEGELPDMAKRIDHIDDRVYLLEVEIASRAEELGGQLSSGAAGAAEDGAAAGEGSPAGDSPAEAAPMGDSSATGTAARDAGGEKGEAKPGILTPEAKEGLAATVDDLREIGRTGAETLSELSDAFSDIAAPFKSLSRSSRRRRF